jgi:GNAT superfamily N-acetyltransferase
MIRGIYESAVGNRAKRDDSYWDHLLLAGGLLVAEKAGRVIAFGGIDIGAAEQVKYLYVLPEEQKTGVGSEILDRLEEIGWRAGLLSLKLHSAPGAVEYYKRKGYEVVEAGERTEHDHEGTEMIKHRETQR